MTLLFCIHHIQAIGKPLLLCLKHVQNVTTHDYFQHCYSDARTTIAHERCSSLLSPMLLNPHLPIMKPLAKVTF